MKISGFTIVRNAVKLNYPVIESIESILPLCDEFIINVGDSQDQTLDLIQSIKSDKIRIIQTDWDMSMGKEVLSHQTNVALKECRGDWAFYLQTDEVVHENDLPKLKMLMKQHLNDGTDVLRFKWFHFYGSYYRYRIDKGWYQKQDRIVRNNGKMQSVGDAWTFDRVDHSPVKRAKTGCFIYHYGWVHSENIMVQRRNNAADIGFIDQTEGDITTYDFGNLNDFPVYFGTHPRTMKERILSHELSQSDKKLIKHKFWWYPGRYFQLRYKTIFREKKVLRK